MYTTQKTIYKIKNKKQYKATNIYNTKNRLPDMLLRKKKLSIVADHLRINKNDGKINQPILHSHDQ